MIKLQIIINQLEEAKKELEEINLAENEVLHDYIFEALRLAKELNTPFSVN